MGTFYSNSQHLIGLGPGPLGGLANFARGVEGYFQTNSIAPGTGPVAAQPQPITARGGGNAVLFTDEFNFLGRVTFVGQNLTFGTATLANGGTLPMLTGGTVTGIVSEFNHRLAEAIDNGVGGDLSPLFNPRFLVLDAEIAIPPTAATVFTEAIVQAYNTNSLVPLKQLFERDVLVMRGGSLEGSDGVNFLAGLDRDDQLFGGASNDVLAGQGGNDLLDGGPGTDAMDGGSGSDFYLPGPPGPEAQQFGVGDVITEGFFQFAPNDVDTLSYQNATGPVVVDLNIQDGNHSAGWALGLQAVGIEVVIGSDFGDVLIGKVEPGGEADTLRGGFGDDTLIGLDGDDLLSGGPGSDLIDGGPQGGTFGGGAGDRAAFNARSDQIDVYFPGDGSVLVAAPGGGIDRLVNVEFLALSDGTFGLGAFGGSQRPLFLGDGQGQPLTGTTGSDLIFGFGGDDVLTGGGGNDSIEGGAGADRIDGGPGADAMIGGEGADVFFVDQGGDVVTEIASWGGGDQIVAALNWSLEGTHVERLTLTGGARLGLGNDLANRIDGNDLPNRLEGGAGDDALIGGGGSDTLIGGQGSDRMEGGAGADIFVIRPDEGPTVATDFDRREGDLLAIDDGFFPAIGDGGIDPRPAGRDIVRSALDSGKAAYDAGSGELRLDGELVAVLEGGGAVLAEDVLLF
ncbi:Alkaline phosphatase (plasmid) [Wenxinia marina DSM 24838]|uniref:Alkaline phosphatase n=1 Tax=Wenxinia marina DSM 24838 TaxID=1123501 RepID=A0A0D0NT73_9RHOB|nr:Alkaline phosphatase [Wenxinia marina DSM 24838]